MPGGRTPRFDNVTCPRTTYAAVYPSLPAGRYTIWRSERSPAVTASITGGEVSSCHWPD